MALHELDVNDKDRQELADAALWPSITGSVWELAGERGAIVHFLPTWVRYDHPLPGPLGRSVVALHDLLYVIRTHQELDDAGTQRACGLSAWLPEIGISGPALAARMSFCGVWLMSRKFTFCRHGCYFRTPDGPGCRY